MCLGMHTQLLIFPFHLLVIAEDNLKLILHLYFSALDHSVIDSAKTDSTENVACLTQAAYGSNSIARSLAGLVLSRKDVPCPLRKEKAQMVSQGKQDSGLTTG